MGFFESILATIIGGVVVVLILGALLQAGGGEGKERTIWEAFVKFVVAFLAIGGTVIAISYLLGL